MQHDNTSAQCYNMTMAHHYSKQTNNKQTTAQQTTKNPQQTILTSSNRPPPVAAAATATATATARTTTTTRWYQLHQQPRTQWSNQRTNKSTYTHCHCHQVADCFSLFWSQFVTFWSCIWLSWVFLGTIFANHGHLTKAVFCFIPQLHLFDVTGRVGIPENILRC